MRQLAARKLFSNIHSPLPTKVIRHLTISIVSATAYLFNEIQRSRVRPVVRHSHPIGNGFAVHEQERGALHIMVTVDETGGDFYEAKHLMGAEVYLCTTRPVLVLNASLPETISVSTLPV